MIREEDVPKEWGWKSLGEICEIVGGKPRPKGEEPYENGTIPFVRMRDLGKYHLTSNLTETESLLNSQYVHINNFRVIKKGSILIPRSGSVALNHRAVLGVDACIVSHICALELTDPNVNNLYLYYVLRQVDMRKYMKKTTGLDLITFYDLRKINVPVPSIEIQKNLILILEKAEQLKQWRKESEKLTDDYLKSVFIELFGNPKRNPKNWAITTISKISTKVTDGEHTTPKRTTSGIKLLSARNIKNRFIDFEEDLDYISYEEYERIKKRCNPEIGDILISCSGTVGRVTTVNVNEPMSMVRSVALIKPNKNKVNSKYLESYLLTNYMQLVMKKYAHTSSQSNLFTGQIKKLPVVLPPLELQDNYADFVQEIEKTRDYQAKSKEQIDDLFSALMQKAFRGELNC